MFIRLITGIVGLCVSEVIESNNRQKRVDAVLQDYREREARKAEARRLYEERLAKATQFEKEE